MKRFAQAVLLVLSGLGVLHATLVTDLYLRYVKEGMRPLLIGSGVLLVALGVAEALSRRKAPAGDGHGHGHDHSGVPKVAWLLFLPALSLLFHAPPALGSYTASRVAPKAVAVVDQDDFDPLPATSPLPITLRDFTQRVQQDTGRAIEGRTVRMTGFVTPVGGGDGWYLTRIMVSCCAADAQSVKVRVYGVRAPAADTWVAVTGVWHPGGTLGTSSAEVALDVRTVEKVERPSNSYTDALPLGE
ncbi:TIGR03943 family putative permease subunit [Streptomyces sp. A012304]|uniref:TIGR03943 family putative permease subunit n=1 Tax=Streptomyces sp. A012304 TaxID=375446 RepID=UPI0022314F7D|nr:TIGR03943 family protein [Streptomyces sp. A012304]GKQ39579.1 membrane protein [Streptomyces sp. A012304]